MDGGYRADGARSGRRGGIGRIDMSEGPERSMRSPAPSNPDLEWAFANVMSPDESLNVDSVAALNAERAGVF